MHRDDIINTILDAITLCNAGRPDDAQVPVAADTALYGKDGHLDSMALVALLIDIEDALLEQDIQLTLSDERAMSQKNSPFRDVQTLADYIEALLNEQAPGTPE